MHIGTRDNNLLYLVLVVGKSPYLLDLGPHYLLELLTSRALANAYSEELIAAIHATLLS